MSTQETRTKEEKAVAVRSTGPTVIVPFDYGDHAGTGYEGLDDAQRKPKQIKLLQSMSPEVAGGEEERVEGARAGAFLLPGGEVRETFRMLIAEVVYLVGEWKPRNQGGGFVVNHARRSPLVTAAQNMNGGNLYKAKTESGNELVETAILAGVLLDEEDSPIMPFLFYLDGMKRVAFEDFTDGTGFRVFRAKSGVPLQAIRLDVTSKFDRGRGGQPYHTLKFSPSGGSLAASAALPTSAAFLRAIEMKQRIKQGAVSLDSDDMSSNDQKEATEAIDAGAVETPF